MRMRWLLGTFAVALLSLLPSLQGSPAASAEPVIPSPSRIVLNLHSGTVQVTSGTIVPTYRLIEEVSTRCMPANYEGSYAMFDVNGVITGHCEYDFGDDSFQRAFASAGLTGSVDLETGAMTFGFSSSVTNSMQGTSNRYDLFFSGTATIPANYFPTDGVAQFSFTRSCSGPTCYPGDSSYSYEGTIGFTFEYFPIAEADLTIYSAIAVQVVESAEPLDASELKVADKATVVRVFVTADQAVGGVTVTLAGTRNGAPLSGEPTLLADSSKSSVVTPNPNYEGHSFNFRLPASWTTAGTIQIEAKTLPPPGVTDPDLDNNSAFVESIFIVRSRLSITYLPVCVATGDYVHCPASGIAEGEQLLNQLFPQEEAGAIYEKASLPPWIWTDPLVSEEDGDALIAALQKRYNLTTLLGLVEGPDQLAAWIPTLPVFSLPGGQSDPSFLGGAGRVSFSRFDAANPALGKWYLAHEVAHNLGRRHPATEDSCGSADPATDWPAGTTSTIKDQGWNMLTNEVAPDKKKDLMSYCAFPASNIWILRFTFDRLFTAMAPGNPPGPSPATSSLAPQSPARYFVVSGSAQADGSGGSLDAGYSVESIRPPEPLEPSPTHCIRFNSATANDHCFRLTFINYDSGEATEAKPFSLAVPLPSNVSRISLIQIAGNVELAAMDVSPSAPLLAVTSPVAGDAWDGEQTVEWTADDPDGGVSTSSLLYSADGGQTWLPLAVDLQGTSFTFDTDQVQHGQVQFRVLGSDGFNTSDVASPVITVLGPSGDVDCNGSVDAADALAVLEILAGLASDAGCVVAADVTCSSSVGLEDALGIRRNVALLPVTLPPGCPPIGAD